MPNRFALALLGAIAQVAIILPIASACPCSEITSSLVEGAVSTPVNKHDGFLFSLTPSFKREFDTAIENAKKACEKHIGEPNVCVVTDVDETILDNREEYNRHPVFKWDEFSQWISQADAPTFESTVKFLAWARENKFAVFLITGRTEETRAGTIENLVRRHIAYDGLYMHPQGDKSRSEVFKTQTRKAIEDMGFKIVASIGDQYSDLVGGYAEDCEKLPNKMYIVP